MDSCIKLCLEVIRFRINYLLNNMDEGTPEQQLEVLEELNEIREELDHMIYMLTII